MQQCGDCSCWHSCGLSVLSFCVSWAVWSRGVGPVCVPASAELCSAAEAQTFSVSSYWHLSCRRVLAVGFSIGVCCVPVSANKILFKKQESFLPGLSLLLRWVRRSSSASLVFCLEAEQEGAHFGFGVHHSSLSPQ